MSDDKISSNPAIDAALHLDGDPQKLRAYYDDWARSYNLDIDSAGYSGPVCGARLLQRYLADTAAALLDAGCGTGLVGIELATLGYCCIDGFDLSEAMTEQARASGVYRRLNGGIDMLRATDSFAVASYDAVISVGVFTPGHVPPEALEVLLQLVRPGGLLVISTRSQYYDQTGFQQLIDALITNRRLELIELLRDAPYNEDGRAHYWVLGKPIPEATNLGK